MRVCTCCGAGAADGVALPARKPTGKWLICTDCETFPEAERSERVRRRLAEIAAGRHPPPAWRGAGTGAPSASGRLRRSSTWLTWWCLRHERHPPNPRPRH